MTPLQTLHTVLGVNIAMFLPLSFGLGLSISKKNWGVATCVAITIAMDVWAQTLA